MKWPLTLLCFLLPQSCIFGAPGSGSNCQFPAQWRGSWFQSGENTLITINGTRISNKGQCSENQGDMFLIYDQNEKCSRCLVMHEKHPNVIQYKETFCTVGDWDICVHLAGDATLYSLFRSNAAPSSCPFHGPLEFSYTRGGEKSCMSPLSQADACTQDSKLLMRYMACADVSGTESSNVEMECLATWKEGSTQYLVARLSGTGMVKDEDRYRCFAYAKSSNTTWNLGQSGDASCNGLTSATDGAKTHKMIQKPETPRCTFPSWLYKLHSWVALESTAGTRLLASYNNLTILDEHETQYTCHSMVKSSHHHPGRFQIVTRATRGCTNGYVCMVFHRRDDHVMELQQSQNWSQQDDEACKLSSFNPLSAPYTTFITMEPMTRQCPYLGRYSVVFVTKSASAEHNDVWPSRPSLNNNNNNNGLSSQYNANNNNNNNNNNNVMTNHRRIDNVEENVAEVRSMQATTQSPALPVRCHQARVEGLNIGCTKPDIMEFATDCTDKALFKYSCHGTWVENDTAYLVASTETGRYCLVYSATASAVTTQGSSITGSRELTITGHMASCPRQSHLHKHEWRVNLTAYTQCDDVSSASTWRSSGTSLTTHMVLVVGSLAIRYLGR
ncbi:uncharacterized protein LOC106652588 [Trichogramma pretiosum]|uniref:uncharacterized protein LOC106652588 n=1 Tax=Trichogramma pretiosum TaxID=7493 RepID=UPI000C71BB61|nr:uncharacterized protein LOC106652588 [Trichogramma pretiosum]XP_023315060.1 uncharacterized protein LOC106652588 [Trichogramma pretiosum]